MNIWMILSAILLIACALSLIGWRKAAKQRDANAVKLEDMEGLRTELDRVQNDAYQSHRRADALNDALIEERRYSDALEATLDDRESEIDQLEKRLEQVNALKTRAEKDASGALLKAQLYERQYEQLRSEHRKLEKRYRESREEYLALTARNAENSTPKRKAKKAEKLDQISMSELFDMN